MKGPRWLFEQRTIRLALLAATVVVALGVVLAGTWMWHRSRESDGLAALAEASLLVRRAEGAPSASPDRDRAIKAVEAVIASYPRLSAIGQATYQLGNLQYAAGRYAAARAAYERTAADTSAGTLRGLAGMGIGYTWEAEKKYDEAVKAYEQVERLGPKTFLHEEALMAQARALGAAGKTAAAVETYQRLLREAPDSPQASELRSRIASLQDRSPQK